MTLRLQPHSAAPNYSEIRQEDFQNLPNPQPPLQNGSWFLGFERAVNRFLREASDPSLVLGMAAGQLIFAPVRAGLLHALWNPVAKKYLLGSLTSRFLAATVASAAEAPIFWGVGKGVKQRMYHVAPVSWDLSHGIDEMMNLGATMGVLRLTGFGARALLPSFSQRYPALLSGATSVGGLYLAHWGQEQVGWRKNHGNWNRLADALVGTLQFGVTGAAIQRLLGSHFQNFNARLERQLERRENPPSSFPQVFSGEDGTLAYANGFPGYRMSPKLPQEPSINLAKMSENPSYGGKVVTDPTQIFILRVLEKGDLSDLTKLKDLVIAVQDSIGIPRSERLNRYFNTKDPEQWAMGIRITSMGNEELAIKFIRSLSENGEFKQFQELWDAKPHFRGLGDVEIRTYGNISRHSVPAPKFFDRMIRILFEYPFQARLKGFLPEGLRLLRATKSAEPTYEWQHMESDNGTALSIGRVDQVGIAMEFNSKGYLKLPIHLFPSPTSDWIKTTAEIFSREGRWELPPIPPTQPKVKAAKKAPIKKIEPAEVGLVYFSGSEGSATFNHVLRIIKKKLNGTPTEKVVAKIRLQYNSREHSPDPEVVQLPGGDRVYLLSILYNKNQITLALRFDRTGKLQEPAYIGNNLGSDWVENTAKALKQGTWTPSVETKLPVLLAPRVSVAAPVAVSATPSPPLPLSSPSPLPKPLQAPSVPNFSKLTVKPSPSEPPFAPSAEESPVTFALRLIHESQLNTEARQLKLANALENLLQSPQTVGFGVETVARIWGMTKDITSTGQVAVKRYDFDGLTSPLLIYRPPMASTPEAWSELIARALRAELQKSGKPELMVELGSDTGWLSIYMRKLGLADWVVAMDSRGTAHSVTRLNHLINATEGMNGRFENIERWEQLEKLPRPSLVTAILPATDHPLRQNDWSLLIGTLKKGHSYLNTGGRIILGVEKVGDALQISDLFKQLGYRSSMLPLTNSGTEQGARPLLLEGSIQR